MKKLQHLMLGMSLLLTFTACAAQIKNANPIKRNSFKRIKNKNQKGIRRMLWNVALMNFLEDR